MLFATRNIVPPATTHEDAASPDWHMPAHQSADSKLTRSQVHPPHEIILVLPPARELTCERHIWLCICAPPALWGTQDLASRVALLCPTEPISSALEHLMCDVSGLFSTM